MERRKGREEGVKERKKSLPISARNMGLCQIKGVFYLVLLEDFDIVKVYCDLLIGK